MPRLREITDIINLNLKASAFKSRRFQDGLWNTVADLVTIVDGDNKETKRPGIVASSGEVTDVVYNDTFPIQFYHRILGIVYEDDQALNYGNPANTIKEAADMIIICMGDRNRLGVVPEDVTAAIWGSIVREVPQASLTTLQLQNAYVVPGEINDDSKNIFEQEYVGVEFDLPPQMFMVAVKYKIISLYSKNCFQLCN